MNMCSDIIYNLKAYSTLGDPPIGNKYFGGMLITQATRKNIHHNKKYLL